MMNTNGGKVYIDPTIPLEQQFAFLRQRIINFQFNVFEILEEKFGNKGIEIFKTIVRKSTRQGVEKIKGKSFEKIKKISGVPDRILGLHIKEDSSEPDELQYSITYCPFLEESKRRGLGTDFCDIIEDVQIEEVSKNLGEMTEPARMCHGDSKCTIRMKNTFGR